MVKRCLASERQEMMALIAWADMQGIPLVHHANEGARSARGGAIMKKCGLRRGIPDIALYEARGGYFGLFIELKCKRGYSPSEMRSKTWIAQREWLTLLANQHYYAVMAFGWDVARDVVERYMKWPKTTFFSQVNEFV